MMTINKLCRACQSDQLSKVIDLGLQPLANAFLKKDQLAAPETKYPLEIYFCLNCNHLQLIHVMDKEILFRDYVYFSSNMPKVSAHWQKYAEDIIARFLRQPNDLVVELGSNDGILLKFFKEKGYRITGVDPAKNIATLANERGVETIAEFFNETVATQIATTKGKAKAILGNNVIAHIDDYETLGKGLSALLDKDGVFVFEAPYLVDMFENLTFDTIYHEHLSYLAVRPMNAWLKRFGLEIFAVQIVPSQGQSIRVFAGHLNQHPIDPDVSKLINRELALGLDKKETYLALAKKIEVCKIKTMALLKNLKAQGKTIAGYGAPAKGNTLLNYFGIDTRLLGFCLDDAPPKQGLYTPGTHIPVVNKTYAKAHQPDYYFLLAWNYAAVILEKEKEFLAKDGAFILPTGTILREATNTNRMKKILVCGGAGFIGSNFIHHLYNKYPDYQIFNLDCLTYCGNPENIKSIADKNDGRYVFVHGDICDSALLQKLFIEHQFDCVVNFAAESHVDRSLHSSEDFVRTNVMGVRSLIDTARAFKTPRYVQISTDEVYGDVLDGVSTEESPLNPSNPYAASKAAADLLIKSYMRSHNFPAVIIRGSNNFGPLQYPEKLIPLVISNFLEKKKIPVHGDGQHIRRWIYVGDFCNAIDLVMHQGKLHHTYNAAGTPKTNLEIIEVIAKNLNFPNWRNEIISTADRPGADRCYAPDATKLTGEFGWQPLRSFDEDMQHTVSWYLNNKEWWLELIHRGSFKEYYEKQYKAQYY